MRLKDLFSPRFYIPAILIFALLIPIAIRDSNNQVKVSFDDANIYTSSNKYNMTVAYEQIESIQLIPLAEAGEKVEDGYDDDILRAGKWKNDTWGEYYITADLDTSNCVVMHLTDGRIFVFSCKNDDTTASLYDQLQTHLN